MSISSTQLITITDAVNYFNSKAQTVLNKASYHSGYYPSFSGQCKAGGLNQVVYLTNPSSIPNGQLAGKQFPSLTINNGLIKADDLWNSIVSIAHTFNKVRRYNSEWRHRTNATWATVNTNSGHAVFNTSFPGVPGGSDALAGTSSRWSRSGSTSVTISPDRGSMAAESLASADSFIAAVDSCYNTWYNSCYNNNAMSYTLYSCHADCHSNCHSNRGRR